MIRNILGLGLAAAVLFGPTAVLAQQAGDSVETYSDTLPKHRSTVKTPTALKLSAGKSVSKKHKAGLSGKSSKGKSGKGKTRKKGVG